MKKYIKFLATFCTILMFTSCLVDDEGGNYTENDQGPNLLGFTDSSINASVVTDGEEKNFIFPVQLAGPTASDYDGEFTATIEVDPASTAIEGVHYTLSTNTVTISSANNLLDNFPLTIITAGIVPPLAENPILTLNITSASDSSVVPNGRTASLDVVIEYLCFSDITGAYECLEGEYWRIGSFSAGTSTWPPATDIIFLCGNTYRVIEYFGLFDRNEFYFEVDELDQITYPATTPDGIPQTGNGQLMTNCIDNPGDLTNIPCGPETNYVDRTDGITLYMSFGYFTPGSGPREFYQVMRKL